jgi:hypothetical protein
MYYSLGEAGTDAMFGKILIAKMSLIMTVKAKASEYER